MSFEMQQWRAAQAMPSKDGHTGRPEQAEILAAHSTPEQWIAVLEALEAAEDTLTSYTPTHARQALRLKLAAAKQALA